MTVILKMQYLNHVLLACADFEQDLNMYYLRELLPLHDVQFLNRLSPPPKLRIKGLNMTGADEEDIIKRMFHACLGSRTKLDKNTWKKFVEMGFSFVNSGSPIYKTVAGSMLLQLASASTITITTVFNGAPLVVAHDPFPPDEFLENYLLSDRVTAAFKTAAGPYFTSKYRVVPYILIFDGLHQQLEGFLSWNNCIAVRRSFVENYSRSPTDRVCLANLIAHEVQHGIWRMKHNLYSISKPNFYPAGERNPHDLDLMVQESGERHERAVWRGNLPNWMQPLRPAFAQQLATRIVEAFTNNNEEVPTFPEFSELDVTMGVGVRAGQTTNPLLAGSSASSASFHWNVVNSFF